MVLDALTNEKTGAISSLSEIDAIGHRVVHGGEKFACSAIVDTAMIDALEECTEPVSYTHLDVYKRQPYGRHEAFPRCGRTGSHLSAGQEEPGAVRKF